MYFFVSVLDTAPLPGSLAGGLRVKHLARYFQGQLVRAAVKKETEEASVKACFSFTGELFLR